MKELIIVFLLLFGTENVFGQTNSSADLKPCPEMICTQVFIPDACKVRPVINVNGTSCYGCPQWKDSCVKTEETAENIPKYKCPETVCTLEFIPNECKEIPKTNINGVQCEGCPRWKAGCIEKALSSVNPGDSDRLPQIACPMLNCGLPVPRECRAERTYTTGGKVCALCPDWQPGCREEERLVFIQTPRGAVPSMCPEYACPVHVPVECQEPRPYNFRGRNCFQCPTWRSGCKVGDNAVPLAEIQSQPSLPCPILDCRRQPGIENNCYEPKFFTDENGRRCELCPTVKPECRNSASPRLPSIPCPLLACPAIYIPDECKEVPVVEMNGQMCKQCPIHREGCVPNKASGKNLLNDMVIPGSELGLSCPLLNCPAIYIPAECREIPELMMGGRLCKQCPRHREGCVPAQGGGRSLLNDIVIPDNRPELPCPLLNCPAIYIPDECREIPELMMGGRLCKQCPRHREGCVPAQGGGRSLLNDIVIPDNRPELPCPLLACPAMYIPDECREIPELMMGGRLCKQCPRHREGCVPVQGGGRSLLNDIVIPDNRPELPCPLLACPAIYIPDECREVPEVMMGGRLCKQCPRHREGCVPVQGGGRSLLNDIVIPDNRPELPCPLLACPAIYIPEECREVPEKEINGQKCKQCPRRKPGCVLAPSIPCPLLACPQIYIPEECKEIPEIILNGQMCKQCPRYKAGCVLTQDTLKTPLNDIVIPGEQSQLPCPLLACPEIYIPDECKEIPQVIVNGRVCRQCPIHRQGCGPTQGAGRTLQNDTVIPENRPELPCPLLACPAIYIPEECVETPEKEINGRMCKQCPRHRQGCVPSLGGGKVSIDTDCPPKPCTRILIPPSCREERTYVVNGKTCRDCPRWRENCIPGQEGNGNTGVEISCPLVACPRIFIPPTCRLEQPYQFQGKTCFKCPTWKPSCRSGVTRPNMPENNPWSNIITGPSMFPRTACPMFRCERINAPEECIMPTTFEHNGKMCPGCPTQKPGCPEAVSITPTCPVMPCPMIYIPEECKEQRPFNYRGTTCFGCPRRKPGCVPSEEPRLQPSDFATQPTATKAKNDSNSLVNLAKGPIPVDKLMSQVEQLTCPPLPCPDMLIPDECQEQTSYSYQGRVCRGCPRWRFGCQPRSGGPMNFNANGILSFSLFNELFVKK